MGVNIALLWARDTYSYGCMMMAENFIHHLNKLLGNVSYYTDAYDEDIVRLSADTGSTSIHKISDLGYSGFNVERDKRRDIKNIFFSLTDARNLPAIFKKNSIKNFVVLGGDVLSEYYSIFGPIKNMMILNYLAKSGINIFIVGHTIGPFRSWRVPLMKNLLSHDNIHIYTRDMKTYAYLKDDMGLKNVVASADLAFLDLPKQSGDMLIKYGLDENDYITVVPSSFWNLYSDDAESYADSWCDVVERLLKKSDKKIVLLAHDVRPNKDDRKMIDKIAERIKDERLVAIKDVLYPYQAREILGKGHLTITGRMHAAISTFKMRKPAISISYSVKYDGVIGTDLNMPELIIEKEVFNSNSLGAAVEEKLDYVTDNYDRLIKEISDTVPDVEKKSAEQIEDVARKIGGI